jgi:hypothetical protein
LCNADGQQITSGALATRPFVATVVSSTPAVTPYNDDWRTAILMAYQVQPVLPAGAWSGQGLTASSRYTNPNHPMAAATSRDSSLRDFLVAYPAVHRGLVELRLYLGTKGQPQYATRYPTLAIKVTGDTWRAIGGGPVDCTVGKAVSIETLLLPSTTTTTGASAPTTSPQASTTSTSTVGGTTPTSTAPEGTTPRRSSLAELAIVVVLFAIVLVGVTFGLRKRSTTDDQPTKDAQ